MADDIWARSGGIYIGYGSKYTEGPPRELGRKLLYAGDRHLCTFGPNGSGKSRRLIYPNALGLKWSCIFLDPKGEIALATGKQREKFGRVIYLNPYKIEGLPDSGFNPIAQLDPTSDEFIDDAFGQAEAIISTTNTKEPHFAESAQDLVTACIMYVRILAKKKRVAGVDNYETVRKILGMKREEFGEEVNKMLRLSISEDIEELGIKAARYFDIRPDNKELSAVISTALTQTRWLDSPKIKSSLAAGNLDFASLKDEVTTVYLILPAKRLQTQSPWLRLVITCALQELMRKAGEPKVPTLLCFDETYQLSYLPAMDRYMPLMRGYGLKLWTFWQDVNQLESVYENRWKSFIANAGVVNAFAPQDMDTADFLSRRAHHWTQHPYQVSSQINPETGRIEQETVSRAPVEMPVISTRDLVNMDQGYMVGFSHKVKGLFKAYLPDPSEKIA